MEISPQVSIGSAAAPTTRRQRLWLAVVLRHVRKGSATPNISGRRTRSIRQGASSRAAQVYVRGPRRVVPVLDDFTREIRGCRGAPYSPNAKRRKGPRKV